MIKSRQHIRIALLAGCVMTGCFRQHPTGVEVISGAPLAPSFMLENMSHDKIAVYLVEGTNETLLRRIAPLQIERVPIPDRVFTSRGATVTLAIVRHTARTMRPSQEEGALVTVPFRRTALIGRRLTFTEDRLYQPYR